MSFWGELRRRNVVKVAVAYAIVGWLLIQVADTFFPLLQLPEWTVTFVAALLILGFPVALLLSWAYELTPDGVKRSHHVPVAESITHVTSQKLNYVITGLVVLVLGFIVIDQYVLVDSTIDTSRQPVAETPLLADAENEPERLPNSIAVIPFSNLSPLEEDAYFAAGIQEEILNQLGKLSNISVIARTSVMQYADTQKTIPEIALELNVESVMEGSVRYADGQVLVTTQLIDAATSVHLWSESYQRDFSNIFEIQSDIAMNVANALQAEFSDEEQVRIEDVPTDSVDAYERYLAALAVQGNFDRLDEGLQSVDAALDLDPDFAAAWALKSAFHSVISFLVPFDQVGEQEKASLDAALRAIELDPTLADAYVRLGTASAYASDWRTAELSFQEAISLAGNESALATDSYVFRIAVGDFERAHQILEALRISDPLNPTGRAYYMSSFALLGDPQRAEAEYARIKPLFESMIQWLGDFHITVVRFGVNQTLTADDVPLFGPIHNEAREFLGSPEEGLAELRRAYGSIPNQALLTRLPSWAAYFGDAEFALEVLEALVELNVLNIHGVWAPHMREVRQLPRFKSIVRDIGLIDYWNEFGWPTICHPLDGDNFECS